MWDQHYDPLGNAALSTIAGVVTAFSRSGGSGPAVSFPSRCPR